MTDPTPTPTPALSQTAFQRVVTGVAAKLGELPSLAKASDERLAQKATDNLWAAIFAIPGLIMLLGWPIVLVWRAMSFSGWNLVPMGVGFILLLMGAVNGDKDVLTRMKEMLPVLQGFVNLVRSFIPGMGGSTPPPPPSSGP